MIDYCQTPWSAGIIQALFRTEIIEAREQPGSTARSPDRRPALNLIRGGLTFERLLRLRSRFHKPDRRCAHPPQVEQLEHRHLLSGGTWTELANPSPATATLLLLSSGEVMAEGGGGYASKKWDLLSPSSTGSYVHGSWSKLASMHTSRLFFASDVLPSGDVFVAGGEYSQGKLVESNRTEIYNPNTNTWESTAPFPQPTLGDAPSEVLPNGSVLVGDPSSDRTYIYSPATERWSQGGTKLDCDSSSEETWVKLPDGSILSYSINASVESGISQAQRYLPSIGALGAHPPTSRSAQLCCRRLRNRAGLFAARRTRLFPGWQFQYGPLHSINEPLAPRSRDPSRSCAAPTHQERCYRMARCCSPPVD